MGYIYIYIYLFIYQISINNIIDTLDVNIFIYNLVIEYYYL